MMKTQKVEVVKSESDGGQGHSNKLDVIPQSDSNIVQLQLVPVDGSHEAVSVEVQEIAGSHELVSATGSVLEETELNESDDMLDDSFDSDVDENEGVIPDNLQSKIDQVSSKLKGGPYRFSGTWKKPPKSEELVQTRLSVLRQIQEDFNKVCKLCFMGEHENEVECPLNTPARVVENNPSQQLRFEMPDDIVFGTSRVFQGKNSLFARDEIAAYTMFGPLKGKLITFQDVAAMNVITNQVSVANLWPLPIENDAQHEFDFQWFISTGHTEESNWLQFIQIESSNEEHPPYNIQTVYKGSYIYFVTTKEIEPGGELFLRPFEPPFRVYYNMHRLGEVHYDFCSRGKCKPSPDEHLQLENLVSFVRHQFLTHITGLSVFSWAAIYNCTMCSEDCFDNDNFQKHMLEKHKMEDVKQAPNACKFCGLVIKSKNWLYRHIEMHHAKTDKHDVPCPYCGKIFKHLQYLKSHIRGSHTNDPEPCPVCKKLCKNRYRMRAHLKKVHGTNVGQVMAMEQAGDLLI